MALPPLPDVLHNVRFILSATITAKTGKEATLQAELAKVRARAVGTDEPRTFTYRTCVSATRPGKFIVFEEYDGKVGLDEHTSGGAFQALASSGLIDTLEIEYYKEFE